MKKDDPKPIPTLPPPDDKKNVEVTGTGRVLVISGPIDTIKVESFNGELWFYVSDNGNHLEESESAKENKKTLDGGLITQYEIKLLSEDVYKVTITVRDTGNKDGAPLGISIYTFDENKKLLAMSTLKDGLLLTPEDNPVEVTIPAIPPSDGNDKIVVKTKIKNAENPAIVEMTNEKDTKSYPITAVVTVNGVPSTEGNGGTFKRYGEVAYLVAPKDTAREFKGWFLKGETEPLTTEYELYYFVKGEATLEARYESADIGPGDGSGSGEGEKDSTSGEKEKGKTNTGLLIGLIGGGTVLLAGIVAAVLLGARKNRRVDKRYPLVKEREEILVEAAPLTDMQASVDPNAMAKQRKTQVHTPVKTPAKAAGSGRAGGILVHQGPMSGKTVPVKPGETVSIGRSDTCDVVFPSNYLSRVHCQVRFDDSTGMYMVTDLAANGTYFTDRRRLPNGREIPVEPGTKLLLASNECTITLK